MIACVLLILIVSFAIAAWTALEFWRDNNDLRRRLAEINDAKESGRANVAG